MRDLITLIENLNESKTAPDWLVGGKQVDIRDPRWDAAEYLEGEEFEYEWRLCLVPSVFVLDPDFRALDTSTETAAARMAAIEKWADSRGGIAAALSEQPPIMLWTSAHYLDSVDGYHRIEIAVRAGLTRIPVLVGLGDPVD